MWKFHRGIEWELQKMFTLSQKANLANKWAIEFASLLTQQKIH